MSNVLDLITPWLEGRQADFGTKGINVELTWGPSDSSPAAAWLDFETSSRSARLIMCLNGLADLTVGCFTTGEVLLDDHREISSHLGLDDVAETIVGLFLIGSVWPQKKE
jgi:hypothetical protein